LIHFIAPRLHTLQTHQNYKWGPAERGEEEEEEEEEEPELQRRVSSAR
jgi:hypothetical protein